MADTTFIDRVTPITAEWLNDVNDAVYAGTDTLDPTNLKYHGAVGDGTDATTAIDSWLAYLSLGTIYGEARRRKGRAPAGVYLYTGNLTITADGIQIEGDGDLNTIFLFSATTGAALTIVGNQFDISNLAIYATAARLAGSGNGITIDASLSTTSARGTLRNIHVLHQPGNGIEAVRTEHHTFDRVWASYCGGKGIYLNHGAGSSAWNYLLNCRAWACAGIGIELSSAASHNTLVNCEGLSGGSTAMKIAGRGNILISPDCENVLNTTGATSYTGLHLLGTRHHVIGGYFGDLNRMIYLEGAAFCTIDQPTMTTTSVTAPIGIELDATSTRNVFKLPGSATNITAILSPTTGNDGDIILSDGMALENAKAEIPVTVAGGSSYTPDVYYHSYYVITLDQNITINLPSNVRANQRLKFRFIQNGTGGYTVTWNSGFKQTWSNTGNTANKQSMINFMYAGSGVYIQDGAQSTYV